MVGLGLPEVAILALIAGMVIGILLRQVRRATVPSPEQQLREDNARLRKENARLREEIERLRHPSPPLPVVPETGIKQLEADRSQK